MIVNNTFSFSVETALPPNTRMQSDRFAREIVAILVLSDAARLRRLMRSPLGGARKPLSFQARYAMLLLCPPHRKGTPWQHIS